MLEDIGRFDLILRDFLSLVLVIPQDCPCFVSGRIVALNTATSPFPLKPATASGP